MNDELYESPEAKCRDILTRAERQLLQPLKNLQYRDSPDKLCANRDEDQTLGDCIASLVKPGEVAWCLGKKVRTKSMETLL